MDSATYPKYANVGEILARCLHGDEQEDEVPETSPRIGDDVQSQEGDEEEKVPHKVAEGHDANQAKSVGWPQHRLLGEIRPRQDQPSGGLVHGLHANNPQHELRGSGGCECQEHPDDEVCSVQLDGVLECKGNVVQLWVAGAYLCGEV
jgi:hypothetical protein